ncbi:hypothetical protein, partial [Microbacterium petrolearium]
LDLQQWALEDPARWAEWAAPSPITEADLRGQTKADRLLKARMQARTRTLVPVLPRLCQAPGLMETSKTRKDLEHGCTTEVPRRVA